MDNVIISIGIGYMYIVYTIYIVILCISIWGVVGFIENKMRSRKLRTVD